MPQSLSNVMLHLVFSTKSRSRWLHDTWRDDFHSYIGGVLKQHNCLLIIANSVEDHIHIFFAISRTMTIADIVKEIKTATAKWIHRKHENSQQFAWQRGYGIFSVSPGHKEDMIRYIRSQKEHHLKVSFQDEFRRLLGIYQVEYDEAYVWD